MSQSGLLSEEEIRSYLNGNFNLKLDRDALIKPQKEVIVDIYNRFLDDITPKWRETRSGPDDFGQAVTIGRIRSIVKHYNTDFTFGLTDLVKPSRKRTTTFLNIFIYFKEQFQQSLLEWQSWKDEWFGNQEGAEEIKRKHAQLRLTIEENAIKKASLPSIEALKKSINEERREFEALKLDCDRKGEEKAQIKATNESLKAEIAKKQAISEALDAKNVELEKTLQMLDEGRCMKEKITELDRLIERAEDQLKLASEERDQIRKKTSECDRIRVANQLHLDESPRLAENFDRVLLSLIEKETAASDGLKQEREILKQFQEEEAQLREKLSASERHRSNMEIQFKIKEAKLKKLLEERISRSKELTQENTAEIKRSESELASIRKRREEVWNKQENAKEQCQTRVEHANRLLEPAFKRFQESKLASREIVPSISELQRRIECTFGQAREVEQPANMTYIKEPASDRQVFGF